MKSIPAIFLLVFLFLLSGCVTVDKSMYKWEPQVIAAIGSIDATVLIEAKHEMAPEIIQIWRDWMNTEQNIENWKIVMQEVTVEDMSKSGLFKRVVSSGQEGYQFIVRIHTKESQNSGFVLDTVMQVINPATMETVLTYQAQSNLGASMFDFSSNLRTGLANDLAKLRTKMLADFTGENSPGRLAFLSSPAEYHATSNYQPAHVAVRDVAPPTITLVSPQETRGMVVTPKDQGINVIGLATDESPILAVLVNDAEAELNRIQGGANFKFALKPGQSQDKITIKAIDQYGNISQKSIALQQETVVAEKARPVSVPGSKPNLWILAVGISKYQDKSLNLKYADNDARSIAETMKRQEGKLYKEVNYRLLLNENGTRENILDGISKYLGMASYDDLVLIFMAGHGVKDKQTGSYYFLPYDANPDTLMTRGLLWSTFDEAQKRLASNVSKIMLWLDTCHAGAMQVAMRGAEAGEELSQELKSAEGTYIIAASKPGEDSEESKDFKLPTEQEGHGVFTYSLLEGLASQAADTDGNKSVTISELSSYVAKQVPRLTKGRQHPYFRQSGTDAPIFIK